ncbi:hypothetical protein QYE76_000458 [Lolium multiflorum]|uniref:Uncharacterized protein n=1 Tax=Lolium multiflorum TaxID=4521 RepID=A0AAD8RHU2_LOLMU|nr:hypothetical protein QYE76_000458 [Lolium multiflorum]
MRTSPQPTAVWGRASRQILRPSLQEHVSRNVHVKEFDSAWYDATANVVSTADAQGSLEELLGAPEPC